MKSALVRFGAASLFALVLAGCGGGGDDDSTTVVPPPTGSVKDQIAAAATDPANDTSVNSSASFSVLQNAGVPVIVVNSPPKVNFTVFSDRAVLGSLTLTNMSFAIAKLVPGTDGEIDKWVNYVYNTVTANASVGPGGATVITDPVTQPTSDPKTAATLVFNPDGYYTYTFTTDITDPTKTNGVVFEPGLTHRVAIQLSYTNAAGETIRVNPYFDVTFDASGNSVAVTDPTKTRKMTDVASCNGCHDKLSLHGGGRVDTQFCVMCHNPSNVDPNSGNNLTLMTMVHKIHAGRLLKTQLDAGKGGEEYTIWGYRDSEHNYSEIGFPQDLRNCTRCHSGDNPATPQGGNWAIRPGKEACLTCHANQPGSDWYTTHSTFASEIVGPGKEGKDLPNSACANCHKPGSQIAPERVHWNQNEENGAKYKMNIESVVFNDTPDKLGRSVTVKYFLSDPTNSNAAYDLTEGCTAAPPNICTSSNKFGNLALRVAYQNMIGQPTGVTEFTAYNNGGSGANINAYKGTNDGSNHYTVNIPLPDDVPDVSFAAGTARVVSIGQVKEPRINVKTREVDDPTDLVNVVVQNAFQEFAISGPLTPRRKIVATEKCNVCHGALGTTSGSNTLANAFHGGARNIVEACVVCHDPNRVSSTVMANGLAMNESYQFKRMIHGIHGNGTREPGTTSARYPFTHGNRVVAEFDLHGVQLTDGYKLSDLTPVPAGTLLTDALNNPTAVNFAAEVHWPGMIGINCNACHVDNSYKVDRGPIGAVVSKLNDPADGTSGNRADPKTWLVITPKAATCTACHDSGKAISHVASFGGAGFGNKTQAESWNTTELCADCHSSGGIKPVDTVHGQK